MTSKLEDRLHAAAGSLDKQIELHAGAHAHRAAEAQSAGTRTRWTLAVATSTAVLLLTGLIWLNSEEDGPSPADVLTTEVVETTVVSEVLASTTTQPPQTVAPTMTTAVPYEQRPPIAVGEAVMLGAVPQLQAGGFTVYADNIRQADSIATVVEQLRTAGQIGATIVIQTGTNGPVTAEQYDAIMSFLPTAEVPHVVFLTVSAPKPFIEANNVEIWALPARYPNVTVLDWQGLSHQIEGELSGSDGGVHLRTEKSKQFYANYIFSAIGRSDLVRPLP